MSSFFKLVLKFKMICELDLNLFFSKARNLSENNSTLPSMKPNFKINSFQDFFMSLKHAVIFLNDKIVSLYVL